MEKEDISRIIGCDPLTENDISVLKAMAKSKKLLRAAKALYYLFNTISALFRCAYNKEELLRHNKSAILYTIEKVRTILGTKRILKAMGLSRAKMYYWIEKKEMSKLCFSTMPKAAPKPITTG